MLAEAGYGPEHVVCCGVWLDDPRDFQSFNKVFKEYFGANPPARACVVSSMVIDCKVEVDCVAYKKPYRPEAEGSVALPRHEFGLDVIALVGRLRYSEHRSVPEIRVHLVGHSFDAVTMTAAAFLSAGLTPGGSVMPRFCSIVPRLCVVKGVCVVWSPEPSRPTTKP